MNGWTRAIIVSATLTVMTVLSVGCNKQSSNHSSGNTYYFSFKSEPTTLNPINSSDYYATKVQDYVVDRLLNKDPDTNEYLPGIAESWEVSADGKKYTFKIRKDAKFTNGEPVTVEDVKFSFDAIKDPKYEAAHKLAYVQGIGTPEILSEDTIMFPVERKYFGNLDTLARLIKVVPKSIYEKQSKDNKLSKTLVGSGPYMIDKYNKAKSIVLKKNTDWWGYKSPSEAISKSHQFDRIVIRFIKEDAISLEMLKKGQLSYRALSGEDFEKKIDTTKPEWSHITKLDLENSTYKSYSFVAWNLNNPIFAGKDTRRALTHLMNRQLIIERFMYGKGYLANGPWYRQSQYADPNVKDLNYDPDAAKALLAKDGWKDSDGDGILDKTVAGKKVDFRFTLLNPNRDVEKYFTLYKEDLKKAGIDLDIRNADWNSFIKALDERKFDAVTLAWSGDEDDIEIDPKQIWHSQSADANGSNFINYKNKRVDELIDKAQAELDAKKRIPLLREVYKIIADDAPYLFLFIPKSMHGVDKKVQRPKDTYKYTVGIKYWSMPSANGGAEI
ncbi:MAG: ABC transporter substrate-binding protein [Bdellovibrionaceae bacterium]|nr:ABC transporter substrate-binding protein [Pseudobdellovibrionaceae bacterium]